MHFEDIFYSKKPIKLLSVTSIVVIDLHGLFENSAADRANVFLVRHSAFSAKDEVAAGDEGHQKWRL
jgi:hypothetical protein